MIVTRLKIANLRAIETAEFQFLPGFNLVVGINGVGKTSVLDALVVCLSAVIKQTNMLRSRVEAFSLDDIRIGASALTVECSFRFGDREHSYLVHKPRYTSAPQEKKAGMPRQQVHDTPPKTEFMGELPQFVSGSALGGRPLAALYSTKRAEPSDRAPGKTVAAGGIVAAFGEAFANRELRLREFAEWMKVQEALSGERAAGYQVLLACEDAIQRFLPGYRNLRQEGEKRPQLWIDRNSTAIPVRHLSDGERGSLALVLDITRRLAQANPELGVAALEAEAVLLIDEIDLHLHPKWQRQIVHNLTATFPNCQFIATTHSPQVIGEVSHERIHIIAEGEVYSPTHSYGVDSGRVLEELMETDSRTKEVHELLNEISRVISTQNFDRARELLGNLVEQLGEADPEVTRTRTLLDFLEGKE